MDTAIDNLMDLYDRGTISRRNLVKGLLMFAATPAAALTQAASVRAQSAAAPMTRVRNINHVHFDVSDLQRSADFYGALLGATVHEKAPNFWTMTLPTGTPGLASWLSLTKAPQPEVGLDGSGLEPGHYSHMGIGIDIPDVEATERLSAEINEKYPFAKARPTGPWNEQGEYSGSRSIYLEDPDGLVVQLIRPDDDGYLTNSIRATPRR